MEIIIRKMRRSDSAVVIEMMREFYKSPAIKTSRRHNLSTRQEFEKWRS